MSGRGCAPTYVLPVPGSILLCLGLLGAGDHQHNSVGTGRQQKEHGEVGGDADADQLPAGTQDIEDAVDQQKGLSLLKLPFLKKLIC
ncbi:hypothetical protein CEXT_337201 [Caerostris extrusa]|uniref:Uncharacterized protein n=1 Tax=Caerostris extrusa TaxID=172846 RepID=A0AAV4NH11_CAEEX|nr:hypothetical protein CEXT_337201 [Caerostris extrusa]